MFSEILDRLRQIALRDSVDDTLIRPGDLSFYRSLSSVPPVSPSTSSTRVADVMDDVLSRLRRDDPPSVLRLFMDELASVLVCDFSLFVCFLP